MGLHKRVAIQGLILVAVSTNVLSMEFPEPGRFDIAGSVAVFQDANQRSSSSKPPNSWRSLLPLHSTRSDVERLFGLPKTSLGPSLYIIDGETVLFRYATGNCHESDAGWNVPPDTIFEISVTPQVSLPFGGLKLDLDKFERVEWQHTRITYYTNLDDGVTIQTRMVAGCEAVVNIQYGPSRRDLGLACPRPKEVKTRGQRIAG